MAATESQIMTNVIAAAPPALTTVGEKHARQRVDICRVASDISVDGAGHLYRLTKLRAHDRVTSIKYISETTMGGTDDMNIGIWTPSNGTDDPVVIDADGLVDGYDIDTAVAIPTEMLGTGAGSGGVDDFGKALWTYCPAGPASEPEPGTEYEIVLQSVGDPITADSNMVFIIEYTAGD